MARGRPESLARFKRIALVLSGGGALGAYQAGAYSALEKCGVRPNWIAGTAIGAVNAAIIAGNAPDERIMQLSRFWRELSKSAVLGRAWAPAGWAAPRLAALFPAWPGAAWPQRQRARPVSPSRLRALIAETVDFDRLNSGAIRVVLGAVNRSTDAETFFDNDRNVLTVDHVLAASPLPGSPPVAIGEQLFGGSAIAVSALDDARPADTLCFVVDCYDPLPRPDGGISRTAREIAAMRRVHDLRRRIALLGERIPPPLRNSVDTRRCLSEADDTTMTILHLVHEVDGAGFAMKSADFSSAALTRRWRAGESDIGTSLAHPRWLAPPPPLSGVVVHEMRGGLAAPQ